MSAALNFLGAPEFPSCATTGEGVVDALREITKLAIKSLSDQQPAVRRQIVDGDTGVRSTSPAMQNDGIAHSVYEASRTLGTPSMLPPHDGPDPLRKQSSAPPEPKERRVTVQPAPGRLSFARLWPEERGAAIGEIESSIANGDYATAVRAAATQLAELIESLPGPHGGADPGTKAALLGLDGREYLRVCRLATLPSETLGEIDALLSLHVLVAARLKASSIGI
jgi:hypothetical protein